MPHRRLTGWRRQTVLHDHQRRLARLVHEFGGASRLFLTAFALGLLVLGLAGPLVLGALWLALTHDLPPATYARERPVFQSTQILSRDGQLLYEVVPPEGGRRQLVRLSDLPPFLLQATLAAEDPSFYQNPGVDPLAVLRALGQNLTGQAVVSGASTLTMQLSRNILFPPDLRYERSLERKLKEMIYAVRLSRHFRKDEVLEMYFNEVYYGNMAYGIGAAARWYFGKEPRDLTLAEAALLAGLPQAPSEYDPLRHLPLAKARQWYVLSRMVTLGYLTPAEAVAAYQAPLQFADQRVHKRAPHFVDYVLDLLSRRYGREALYYNGWRVRTTVDLALTEKARALAAQRIAEIRQTMNAHNAAVVVLNAPTAEILAMVGSIDYWDPSIDGQVNVAVAPRMPGSAIKVFTYAAAYEDGYLPASRVNDTFTLFDRGPGLGPYAPHNYNGAFNGLVMLREALGSSLNVPAVKVVRVVTPDRMVALAHRLGITTLRDYRAHGLSVTLGSVDATLLDLTYAYSVFANLGRQVGAPVPPAEREPGFRQYEPVAILEITAPDGRVVYRYQPGAGAQVLSPQVAYLMTSSLSDDEARLFTFSRHGVLEIDRPAAAKTGTTEFMQDTWTIGYSPDLVVGVWVGNSDGSRMQRIVGVLSAGHIWHKVMIAAHQHLNLPPRPFPIPDGLEYGLVCGAYDWKIVGREPLCQVPDPPPWRYRERDGA